MQLRDFLSAPRARRWIRDRGPRALRVLVEGAAVLGAVLVFVSAGIFVIDRISATWFWRGAEYDKLTSLRAGFDLRYFEDRLGLPFASRTRNGYRENGFKGRGFWVQTISHNGRVELFAVTACDRSFHPKFTLAGTDVGVELNRDHLADIIPGASVAFDYSIGASAPTLLNEGIYGGRSSFYKTTIWGLSSLCGVPDGLDIPSFGSNVSGETSSLSPGVKKFRRRATVNTFAETAPAVDGSQPSNFGIEPGGRMNGGSAVQLYRFGDFYIGPDWVLLQGENR